MNRLMHITQTRLEAGLAPRHLIFPHLNRSLVSDPCFRSRVSTTHLAQPALQRRVSLGHQCVRVAASNGAANEEGRAIMIAVDTSQARHVTLKFEFNIAYQSTIIDFVGY